MPRYAAYTLLNSRRDYRQFFTLEDARAYANTLRNGIVWDRHTETRV